MAAHGLTEAQYFDLPREERARMVGAIITSRALSAMRDYDRAKAREDERNSKGKGKSR